MTNYEWMIQILIILLKLIWTYKLLKIWINKIKLIFYLIFKLIILL